MANDALSNEIAGQDLFLPARPTPETRRAPAAPADSTHDTGRLSRRRANERTGPRRMPQDSHERANHSHTWERP